MAILTRVLNLPLIGSFFKKIFGINNARRYRNLFELIRRERCRRILEIGTYDGVHAYQMIKHAKSNFPASEVEYYGVDLFELMDENKLQAEWSKKPPLYDEVRLKLENTGARVFLFKGDSKVILPQKVAQLPPMDFVFIDGGHSIDTIRSDWECVQKVMTEKTIVVFDDYWNIYEAGCKSLIDTLDRRKYEVEILSPKDRFLKDWGVLEINMVKVRLRTK